MEGYVFVYGGEDCTVLGVVFVHGVRQSTGNLDTLGRVGTRCLGRQQTCGRLRALVEAVLSSACNVWSCSYLSSRMAPRYHVRTLQKRASHECPSLPCYPIPSHRLCIPNSSAYRFPNTTCFYSYPSHS